MPAEVPVERPARFEESSKDVDLNISNLLLARTDGVIE
jgi:hypothetical protein